MQRESACGFCEGSTVVAVCCGANGNSLFACCGIPDQAPCPYCEGTGKVLVDIPFGAPCGSDPQGHVRDDDLPF